MSSLIFIIILGLNFTKVFCSGQIYTQISTTEDLDDYLTYHPGENIISLKRGVTKYGILFALGRRTGGDRLDAIVQKREKWSSPQNVLLRLEYPKIAENSIISYVEIIVDQSSRLSQAFIVNGGIGPNHITIVLEASGTDRLQFTAGVFTRNV